MLLASSFGELIDFCAIAGLVNSITIQHHILEFLPKPIFVCFYVVNLISQVVHEQ